MVGGKHTCSLILTGDGCAIGVEDRRIVSIVLEMSQSIVRLNESVGLEIYVYLKL